MPESSLWAIVISSVFLALGLSLRNAFLTHRLKLADEEIDSLIKQIRILNDDHNKTIMGLSELHKSEKKKLTDAFGKAIEGLVDKMSHSEYSKKTPEKYQNALAVGYKKLKKLNEYGDK
jgi:DNA-binding ferritin-like protein (Dps family)